MKKSPIIYIIVLLLSFTFCFIQKYFYDKKIKLINTELVNIKESNNKLKSENEFINELNKKLLNSDNPIDQSEKECLDKSNSTADSLKCTNISLQKWENEIEKYLGLLQQSMTYKQFEYIKKNQDLWSLQNKNNNEIITKYIFNHGGTMYYQIAAGYYICEKKQRAEFLKSIYDINNTKI